MFQEAKRYVSNTIEAAVRWGGPEAEEALLTIEEALELWTVAGKPERGMRPQPEPEPVIYTG